MCLWLLQLEGVGYFETYVPVVLWMTVRMMLILEILLWLKSKQGDVTAAFLHAKLEPNKKFLLKCPWVLDIRARYQGSKGCYMDLVSHCVLSGST